MFRKSKSNTMWRAARTPSQASSCRFFNTSQTYFSTSAPIHLEIQKEENDDKETLVSKAMSKLRKYPNSLLTFMTPTTLFTHQKANKNYTNKGYIIPGHIHSSCTNSKGGVMEEGDVSFATTGKKVKAFEMITPVYDSRLQGYLPMELASLESVFTSTIHEGRKWADLAMQHKAFPLHVLVMPFPSQAEQERYLEEAKFFKIRNQNRHYILMSHYQLHSMEKNDEIEAASNCVTLNKEFNERYFRLELNLGDNPTTQTAFFELVKSLCPSAKKFSLLNEVDDSLLKVHCEKEMKARYSLVI